MSRPRPVQALAFGAGLLFLVVGVLGFVPGLTTRYGDLGFAGHHSTAQLLGVFQVSALHNLLHVLFGIAGIVVARAADTARTYLVVGGIVYLAVWMLGVVGVGGWIPVDTADNWLHFLLGIGMIGLGLVGSRAGARMATA